MAENPFSSEEMLRGVGYRRLKHAVAQHFPPDAYGALTNLQVVLRNEDSYGEALGVAIKTQIAAGDTYDCPKEYYYVPATWWDHLKCSLFPALSEVGRLIMRGGYVPEDVWEELGIYEWLQGLAVYFAPRMKELPLFVERIHVCPHADIDFKVNPEPHVRHLLEKKT